MPNINNALIATITATSDVDTTVAINRGTGNPAFDATTGQLLQWQALAAGANAIGFPVAPVTQLYLRNMDQSANIIVSWTPKSGANAVIITLYPGDQIIFWSKPGGANAGITALSLNASAACLVEYFIGG